MVKIVKEVKVPMDEVVKYLVEKGYLTDEFEFGNIEKVEVSNRFDDKELNKSGSKLMHYSRAHLNFKVNADLNLNNYIKKNEVDKYINSKKVERSEYTSSGEDDSVDRKESKNNNSQFVSFFELLKEAINDEVNGSR